MGCATSTSAAPAKSKKPVSNASSSQNKSQEPLKKVGRKGSGGASKEGKKGGFMNTLALKFPVINKSFKAVFDNFNKHHTLGEGLNESITADKAKEVLACMEKHHTFTDAELQEMFHIADLDKDNNITFREFLIGIAVGYYLKVDSDKEDFLAVQSGFKVVEQAFRHIDADGSGSIDVQEMKDALWFGHSASDNSILEERFKELNFNDKNEVKLPEFIYAMSSWVGFYDDE